MGGDIRYAYGAWPYTSNGPYISAKSKNTAYLVRSIRCIDNDCSFLFSTIIKEYTNKKKLFKVTDLLGRETKGTKINELLFYIYDDGTVEKRIVID